MSESKFNAIWNEKYRPKTLDDILLEDSVRAKLQEFKNSGEIPNLLFCGPPGQGKTSLAHIIVNSLLDCQYIYLNASDENGIDTIRTTVSSFAQTASIDGALKVIILDEADFITPQGQAALRNTMESYSSNCRFILTANIKHKIVPAIQSRCTSIDIIPPLKQAAQRIFSILKQENIIIEEADKVKIISLIKRTYPDLRKTINELQKSITSGKLEINITGISNDFCAKILELVTADKPIEARTHVIQNEAEFNGDYQQLMRELLNSVFVSNSKKKAEWCLIIADHLYKSVFVVDQEINFFSCVISLSKV